MKRINVTTEQTRPISLHNPKFGLFYVLVLGASLAWPTFLWARASFLGHPLNSDFEQQGGPDNAQQPRSPKPPPKGNGGSSNNQPPAHSELPKGGDVRPQQGPSRPDTNPRPPQTGGPAVKPGRPGFAPSRPPTQSHPPVHSVPRPPAHHYPHHRPVRPRYTWGTGSGWRLHQFFLGDMRPMSRMHRNHFFIGGYFPRIFLDRIQPIPAGLMVDLPPVPPEYEIGYYDGYCLVYDPNSSEIVGVIDLYRY
jgi:hypothetical protein